MFRKNRHFVNRHVAPLIYRLHFHRVDRYGEGGGGIYMPLSTDGSVMPTTRPKGEWGNSDF